MIKHVKIRSVKTCALFLGAISLLPLASAPATLAATRTEKVLFSFSPPVGIQPAQSTLVSDETGNLYGTAYQAGPNSGGEVFKLSPRGKLTVLFAFPDKFGGMSPYGGVLRDEEGDLYGSASTVVFKLAPDGKETALHVFTGQNGDGGTVNARLLRDAHGNIYGSTNSGGDFGAGILFKISPRGKETILHSFNGTTDGYSSSPLLMDRHGTLYGFAGGGGLNDCQFGCGTVFKMTKAGQFSVVYSFTGGNDGASPEGEPVIDKSGNLYGTAATGGDLSCGTVFAIHPDGTETTLHTFTQDQDAGEGCNPESGLSMDADGNFLGVTTAGGVNGLGTVFKISSDGTEKLLYNFGLSPDGAKPEGTLLSGAHNALYGTTSAGGANGWGTVFELSHK